MRNVPARVNQPADTEPSVRPQGTNSDRRADDRIGQFPQTESAAQVHTARTRKDDRIEGATGWLRDERHHGNEHKRAESRSNVVHHSERCRVHEITSMAPSYKTWQNPPVAKKTMIEGFEPRPHRGRPHLVAVVAFDGVVLGDLSTACEVFGLAKRQDGRTAYEVRVCSESVDVESMHVALRVPWRLSSLALSDTVLVPGI